MSDQDDLALSLANAAIKDADDLIKIGRWIERERKARKWTQEQLASRASVSPRSVYTVESGANSFISTTFALIAALEGRFIIKSTTERVLDVSNTQDIA